MTARRWPRYVAIVLAGTVVACIAGVLIAQRMSDGPLTAIVPGGELRSGELVTDAWPPSFADEPVELQLVNPPTSRYTGLMLHDGEVYVPCDLGFMWGRFAGAQRLMLHTIYVFKHWHEDVLEDGRVVLRIHGKRYPGRATLVTDAPTIAALKSQLEDMAREWVKPDTLAPPPTEAPNDIWFFRIDPFPS